MQNVYFDKTYITTYLRERIVVGLCGNIVFIPVEKNKMYFINEFK